MNHKRVYRLYRNDGLSLRLKTPRRNVSAANRERQPAAPAANEMWSMDFVSDILFDSRQLRALTVVDAFTVMCRPPSLRTEAAMCLPPRPESWPGAKLGCARRQRRLIRRRSLRRC
ncbi:hypothetical protein ASE88_04015 [Sphingomonas sp. Leaf38]|nr:hypothetical protein ASE88_04015 [Sphingomonas sp. Leaf38]